MPRRGSVALARSIEFFTIITAAYFGYSLTLGFGFLGHGYFLGWLGAFMLVVCAFAAVLLVSVLVKPD